MAADGVVELRGASSEIGRWQPRRMSFGSFTFSYEKRYRQAQVDVRNQGFFIPGFGKAARAKGNQGGILFRAIWSAWETELGWCSASASVNRSQADLACCTPTHRAWFLPTQSSGQCTGVQKTQVGIFFPMRLCTDAGGRVRGLIVYHQGFRRFPAGSPGGEAPRRSPLPRFGGGGNNGRDGADSRHCDRGLRWQRRCASLGHSVLDAHRRRSLLGAIQLV